MASAVKLVKTSSPKAGVAREWLSLRDLTEYAAVSKRTLRTWLHRAENPLPAVQVDGKILIRRVVFDAWLDRHRLQTKRSLDVGAIVNDLLRDAG